MTHRIAVTARPTPRRAAERATTNGDGRAGTVVDPDTGLSRRRLRTGRPPAPLTRRRQPIHPDTSSIGFLEWHQIDRAREAGRIATREALPRIMEVGGG